MPLTTLLAGDASRAALRILPWALIAPAFLLGQCSGKEQEQAADAGRRAAAAAVTAERRADAIETGAIERTLNQIATEKRKDEIDHAIDRAPDTAPDAARIAAGCQRLRNAGRSEVSLPVQCRPAAPGQARPD